MNSMKRRTRAVRRRLGEQPHASTRDEQLCVHALQRSVAICEGAGQEADPEARAGGVICDQHRIEVRNDMSGGYVLKHPARRVEIGQAFVPTQPRVLIESCHLSARVEILDRSVEREDHRSDFATDQMLGRCAGHANRDVCLPSRQIWDAVRSRELKVDLGIGKREGAELGQ